MIFFLFTQTCESGSQSQGNPLLSLLPLILIFAVFYFLLILPQQRKQKQHQKLLNELQKGDRVVTTSGIYGTITNVKDHTVLLLIADGVKVEIEKGHVTNKVNATGTERVPSQK
jgi:preprotein translocase subunit YajC